jgi:hypothetical protein
MHRRQRIIKPYISSGESTTFNPTIWSLIRSISLGACVHTTIHYILAHIHPRSLDPPHLHLPIYTSKISPPTSNRTIDRSQFQPSNRPQKPAIYAIDHPFQSIITRGWEHPLPAFRVPNKYHTVPFRRVDFIHFIVPWLISDSLLSLKYFHLEPNWIVDCWSSCLRERDTTLLVPALIARYIITNSTYYPAFSCRSISYDHILRGLFLSAWAID